METLPPSAEVEIRVAALRPRPLLEDRPDRPAGFLLPPIGRPPRQRPWRALAAAAAGLLVVGVVAALGFNWWDRSTIHTGGPVTVGGGINGRRLDVGERASFGDFVLMNKGKTPAVLEGVRVLGVSGGFEVLGVRTNPVPLRPDVYAFLGAVGFPPTEYPSASLADKHIVPVAKTRTKSAEPTEGLQLVVGARATVPGVARARGVEFSYRVGHRHYRRSYEGSMYLCAPKEQFSSDTCPGEAEGQFDDAVVDFPVTR
jgi:hypothetical protein